MTVLEILIGIAFVAGALATGWAYTLTDRGRTLGRDTQKANRRARWWLRREFLGRHWPFILLILAYTLGFGVIAAMVS
ncbi:hypothetical protein A8B78_01375 [Jannaschia sp. EhC01]|nr:hypothetical protein A8B78_01375 [Jannaschia sp. EhC01]